MPNRVIERLYEWYLDADDGEIIQDLSVFVQPLAEELYNRYEVTYGPLPSFWQRLDGWVNSSLSREHQKLLFRLIPHIFFVGPDELNALYRSSYNTVITNWLIEQLDLPVQANLAARLRQGFQDTWVCPLTDSLRINSYYHVNRIQGRDLRPEWRMLTETDSAYSWIANQINDLGIRRIVLLEDFVGSGSQIRDAIEYAANLPTRTPVLVVPIICCPEGAAQGREWERRYPHVSFRPLIELSEDQFFSEIPIGAEAPLFSLLRPVINSTYTLVTDGLTSEERENLYGPFGFRGTGGLVVLWTNCPDNTLPAVHQESDKWRALFPRSSRL